MKPHKYQTQIAVISLFCLLAAGLVQWTEITVPLARLIAASPLTNFVEEHIVHRKLNPENIVKNWTNIIKEISATVIMFSLFLLFAVREKFLPRLKSVYAAFAVFVRARLRMIKACLSKPPALFLVCGFFGTLFFLKTFGTAILDVTYTDWLWAGGDLSQHYAGWRMFRNSAWHFPLGLMDNIVYPFKESIIYTDSIPLFALFFKALSPVIPQNFQYFGVFGLVIYFLQGGTAALVIQKLCKNIFYAVSGSFFFIFSTAMIQRIYGHTSLAAHFVILLCIYACMQQTKRSLKSNIFVWSALFALSATLHIYFIPIVFVFMTACLAKDFLEDRRIGDKVITAAVSVAAGLGVMFVLGAFYSHADISSNGLGYYSMNMNALFNPQGSSRFLKDLPLATGGQYEGFGYLGFGTLLACFFLLVSAFNNSGKIREALQKTEYKRNTAITAALFLFFLVFALSPVISFNGKMLFRYYILGIINHVWSIFRGTGRYVWILMYIIMLVMIWAIKKTILRPKGIFTSLRTACPSVC